MINKIAKVLDEIKVSVCDEEIVYGAECIIDEGNINAIGDKQPIPKKCYLTMNLNEEDKFHPKAVLNNQNKIKAMFRNIIPNIGKKKIKLKTTLKILIKCTFKNRKSIK